MLLIVLKNTIIIFEKQNQKIGLSLVIITQWLKTIQIPKIIDIKSVTMQHPNLLINYLRL